MLKLDSRQLMYTNYIIIRIRQPKPLFTSMFSRIHIVLSASRELVTPPHLRCWDADLRIKGEETVGDEDKIHASYFYSSLAVLIKSTEDLDSPKPSKLLGSIFQPSNYIDLGVLLNLYLQLHHPIKMRFQNLAFSSLVGLAAASPMLDIKIHAGDAIASKGMSVDASDVCILVCWPTVPSRPGGWVPIPFLYTLMHYISYNCPSLTPHLSM